MNTYTSSEIFVGMAESFSVLVTREMVKAFCALSGDHNPLHSDRDFAMKYKFNDIVVHGMLTSSFYSTLVGMYLPGRHAFFQAADVAFVAPVYPDDTLTVSGQVVSVHSVYKQIEIKASIRNQNELKVSRAKLLVGINE